MDFYLELYNKKKDTDLGCFSQLLQLLPSITKEQRQNLDSAVSYRGMKCGHAPGIDGLPEDFYKILWKIIGRDFYEVLQQCFNDKLLPKSCQRVLALIP